MSKGRTLTPTPSSGDEPAGGLSKSEIFDLLRNQRRRLVLRYIERHDGDVPAEIGEIATQVAAWENDVAVDAVTSAQRKRVYTTLQQSHLPKLDEAGIVEFDAARGTVRGTDVADDLTIYLEVVPGHEFAWHEFYLGLGAVGCALMAAVWAGIYPFSAVPGVVWGTVVSATVLLSAVAQRHVQRGLETSAGDLSNGHENGP